MLARERLRLTDSKPPPAEPDLSLRPAIAQIFARLDAQSGSVMSGIQAKWNVIAGERIAAHARPDRLHENVLYVAVDSSAWLAEIKRFHADFLLQKIQDEIGRGAVKNIRFLVDPPRPDRC